MKEFEDLIEEIDGHGFYQKRLLYLVLSPLFFFLPLSWLNELFLLHVPSHWCNHPSQLNLTESEIEDWRNCFLPKEISAEGILAPSNCKIIIPKQYVGDEESFWNESRLWLDRSDSCPSSTENATIVGCKLGWAFDQTEFTSTVPTENQWVCENQDYVPQLFTYGVVGSILGTVVFMYLGDQVGRRMIFWITTAVVIIFMAGKTFLAPYFVPYLVFKLVAAASYVATYQLPFSIITEITDASYRSWAIGITCVTWTLGLCLLPLIGWLSGDWKVISLATVVPMICVFAGWPFVPESPRWQLTKGYRDKAAKTIRLIAKANKRPEPKDLENRLDEMIAIMMEEKSLGYISLFTHKGLAIKTFNVTIALVASNFVYYQLMLNIGNMSGSTFLNFFLLSVIEGPAYFLGVWLADAAGRRWSHTCFLTLNTLCLLTNCYLSVQPDLSMGVVLFCLIAKFNCSATFVIVYVQTVELFPTCIRNTGMGFTSILAMIIGIAGPYVVHLGTVDVRYPYGIMASISLCGAIAASFLPETAGVDLPETLTEAAEFGRDQKYFGWVRSQQNRNRNRNSEKIREERYRMTTDDGEDKPLNA